MTFLWQELNLINFLTFYLLLMFAASTWRRLQQYGDMGKLILSTKRWPNLMVLIKSHRTIFLTWGTVAPLVLALALTLLQLLASSVLWPQAAAAGSGLTLAMLFHERHLAVPITVLILAIGVLAVDIFFLIDVAPVGRPEMEKQFDQAEYWLSSNLAHVVKYATFGQVQPRQMVNDEVRKALVDASSLLNSALWWTNLQMALRFCFGLSLWIAWSLGE